MNSKLITIFNIIRTILDDIGQMTVNLVYNLFTGLSNMFERIAQYVKYLNVYTASKANKHSKETYNKMLLDTYAQIYDTAKNGNFTVTVWVPNDMHGKIHKDLTSKGYNVKLPSTSNATAPGSILLNNHYLTIDWSDLSQNDLYKAMQGNS